VSKIDRIIRQIRSQTTQFRAVESESEKYIECYFAVFAGSYEIFPGAVEMVDPIAFDEALDDDIRCLIDHETRLVLGRTTAGTLELKVDEIGLWGRVKINQNDQDAMNLYARVERGDVSQCSFGFDILDELTDSKPDGTIQWTIKKVKLYEVSIVTFPAYEDTAAVARKSEYEQIKKRSLQAWQERMKARLRNGS